ncbi:MAG: ATP-binding protein [Clostridiales bacterium]|nr:ATP-binding protein [Clostridiales bacterium]
MNKLNEMYAGGKFECAIVYGRRRVGKTSLIQEFIKGKRAIYFLSLETSERMNTENFSNCIWNVATANVNKPPHFANFTDALEAVGDLAADERIVLAIDEYPYLAKSITGISSIFQAQIDMRLKNSKLFLILCGSSMSFMENQVLGYQSPLYGRRTAQFNLRPFNFFEAARFHENYNAYDNAVLYGITGGIPHYLSQFDSRKSLEQNIIDNFFDPASYLFEEPSNLLKQELREPQVYNGIISAIAGGSSRLNEIATKTSLETAACSKYLASLISLGIVKKELPIQGTNAKKTIYRLADNMFRFWYRFVPQYISQIQSHAGKKVYDSVAPHISTYMGEVFEDICKQYLWRENLAERLPFYFRDAGRWWGTNPRKKQEEEIDIIAIDDSQAIFCECKWRNEAVGRTVLDGLIEKSQMFNYRVKYYILFSKSGFTDECKAAASEYVRLVDFREM